LYSPGAKELVAVGVSYAVCSWAGFDAYATLFQKDSVFLSKALNALLVAGGSKGAMKLMQDVLGVRKDVMENNIGRHKNRVNYEENVNLKVTKSEE
jgi:hypothetical protein